MGNDNIHAEMHDELAMGAVLANMVPAPSDERAQKLVLAWCSMGERGNRVEGVANRAELGDSLDMVFVQNPATGGYAIVVREFQGKIRKITLDDALMMHEDEDTGVVQLVPAQCVDDERVQGWFDWDQIHPVQQKAFERRQQFPFHKYEMVGMIPVSDEEQGEAVIRQARNAYELQLARNVEGFGISSGGPVVDTALTVGF